MSLAEQMLATMNVDDVAETYSQKEEHIVVNDARQIIVPNSLKIIAVTKDKDVKTITFDCVRYWDGNDLSTFAIYLNYVLPDLTPATYVPKSIITSDGDDFYHFEWEIGNNITTKSGKISIGITAIKTKVNEEGETVVDKQWSSLPNTDCSIALGLDISNVPSEEESNDVVAQLTEILEKIQSDLGAWVENNIVQEKGTSETKVMSQKATTKELEALKSELKDYTDVKTKKLSKRITNLEQVITPDPFETDDSVAYIKDVPVNALPYAEISKIGGMTHKDGETLKSAKVTEIKNVGANLFNDIEWFTKNNFVKQSDGSWLAHSLNTKCWTNTTKRSGSMYITFIGKTALAQAPVYLQVKYTDGSSFAACILHATEFTTLVDKTDANKTVDYINWTYGSVSGEYYVKGVSISFADVGYTPYTETSLVIPEAVQALDGYGEGNPDNAEEYNAIINKDGKWKYVHKGNIENNLWLSFALPEVTDISDLITPDNFIKVEGGGTITMVNEYSLAAPSEITYMLKGVT